MIKPLILWLAPQWLILALAALQIPLSANFPHAAERSAVQEMLVVQFLVSSLLFPLILRDWEWCLIAILAAWPFTLLASALSAQIWVDRIIGPGVYLDVWLASLCAWRYVLRTHKSQLLAVALATCLAAGGPALWYMRQEFGAMPLAPVHEILLGPLVNALIVARVDSHVSAAWCFINVVGVASAISVLIRFITSRHPLRLKLHRPQNRHA